MKDKQSFGFLNRSLVALVLMFTIPTVLVVGGFFFVGLQGRIPGGTDSSCERNLGAIAVRIDVYAYQSGLSQFQLQTFSVSENGSDWRELFKDDVITPRDINCDDNIVPISDNVLLLFNYKTLAISADTGATWQFYNVCDEPSPIEGRCDSDPLNIVSVDLADTGQGRILVQESIVDEYGIPLTENGEPKIKQEYALSTDDFGQTWQLENPE